MVPKVAGTGSSFKGAGLYYLHDKKAETRERVAFTHTENLPTRDPDKAIKCMAWTALRQQELKAIAGSSAKGRKLQNPVYCYSLSWAPGETPSKEDMIAAAKESLKALGLDEHETLLVGHNDEPHPHIHVVVNRVHPETGKAAKLSKDYLRLSSWAEAYERSHGKIRCEQRVENNALRRQGAFKRDHASQRTADYHRWRVQRAGRQSDKRAMDSAVLDDRHDKEREALRKARDRDVEALRARAKDANRPLWRDLYAIQKQERERLAAAQKHTLGRLKFFVKAHRPEFRDKGKTARLEMLKGAFAALIGSQQQFARLDDKHRRERVRFGGKLSERAGKYISKIEDRHRPAFEKLRERQGNERHELKMRQSRDSQKEARDLKHGNDREIFERERPDTSLSGRFAAAKQRGHEEKKKGMSLPEKFRQAQQDSGLDPSEKKLSRFRDNARDVGRGGRERTDKPPKK